MGFCVYFHRTWTPGYNSEYIDPNLAFSFQRKLNLAKKVAWWIFVLTLLSCVILLLVKLYKNSLPEAVSCPDVNSLNGSINSTTDQPIMGSYAEQRFQTEIPEIDNVTEKIKKDPDPTSSPFHANYPIETVVTIRNTTDTTMEKVTPSTMDKMNTTKDKVTPSTMDKMNTTKDKVTPSSMDKMNSTMDKNVSSTTEAEDVNEQHFSSSVPVEDENKVDHAISSNFTEILDQELFSSESEDESPKRNMTTRDSSAQKNQSPYQCVSGDFICNSTQTCIPHEKKCDGRLDCLKQSFQDTTNTNESYPDADRSDELNCPCRPDSFYCDRSSNSSNSSGECVHMSLVCDSIKDCSNGKDEDLCTAVSQSLTKVVMDKRKSKIEGYILVRAKGSWHPYCHTEWTIETGRKVCQFLGYKTLNNLQTIGLDQLNSRLGVHFTGRKTLSSEEGEEKRMSKVWLLGKKDDYTTMSSASIEDAVTESYEEEYQCQVGYVNCSKF